MRRSRVFSNPVTFIIFAFDKIFKENCGSLWSVLAILSLTSPIYNTTRATCKQHVRIDEWLESMSIKFELSCTIYMPIVLATWIIKCYSYSYCEGESRICMHADLMLLYLFYLWIMIYMKTKKLGKIAVNHITIFF